MSWLTLGRVLYLERARAYPEGGGAVNSKDALLAHL